MSEPQDRDILTSNLKPKLASQAPKVSIMILIVGRKIDVPYIKMGINNTVLSIIPSKLNSLIRKWKRCIIRARIIA